MSARRVALFLGLAVQFLAIPVFAQAPGSVHVMLPNGNDFVQSTATTGTLSSGGVTFNWAVGASVATITISGSFTTSWIYPAIDIAWFSTSNQMPIRANITSNAGGSYDLRVPFIVPAGQWDHSLSKADQTGSQIWGYVYPAFSRMDFEIELNDQSTPYDLVIEMEWGAGVPAGEASFGAVKALYAD